MKENKRFTKATWQIMEQLLEVDSIEDALSGTLEIILEVLNSEAGVIWLLDKKSGYLLPMFHKGPADISGLSIEYGTGVESAVIRNEQSVMIADASKESSFEGSVFDSGSFRTKTMICVPLNNLKETVGCVQIINRLDGRSYDAEELQLCERMAALAAITIEEKGLQIGESGEREVLVSLRNVIKEFKVPTGISRVLKGINLDIYKGELLVVLGESGCGKSTMMNIIGGMDALTDGKLLIEGKDYSHPTEDALTQYRRNYIGFIFQSFNLMPNLSALENVRFIAEICPDPLPPEEALRMVGMKEKAASFPSQLSGGQQQRVAIARALVKNPKLILADEPTAALDYETSIEVLTAIERAVRENHSTVIMITHNPEIGKMANRIVRLRGGRIYSIRRNANPLHAAELEW